MTRGSAARTEAAPAPRRRGTRFVPLDDVPAPGLTPGAREVVALALCGLALYYLLALATFREATAGAIPTGGLQNLGGKVGYYLASGFVTSLGYAGWVPFAALLSGGIVMFLGRSIGRLVIKLVGVVAFSAMLAILLAGQDGLAGLGDLAPYGAGGVFGAFVSPRLAHAFGGSGRLLLIGFGMLVALLLVTEWLFSQMLLHLLALGERLWARVRSRAAPAVAVADGGVVLRAAEAPTRSSARRSRKAATPSGEPASDPDYEQDSEQDADQGPDSGPRPGAELDAERERGEEPESEPAVVDAGPVAGRRAAKAAVEPEPEPRPEPRPEAEPEPVAPAPPPIVVHKPRPKPKPKPKPKRRANQSNLPFDDVYPFPPIELFREVTEQDVTATADALARGGQSIVQKLANFGIDSQVVAASVGPAVTQYELRLADNIRVNKVASFESDLAAALRAMSVRIVAPIPGKDTVGVEVPNPERHMVFMRDLLEQFGRAEDLAIPLFLGKDVAGNPIVEDLARMPHLLIAGTTGSGKSVCINAILLSVLMTRSPAQVKLILVDPKMVELQAFKRVPHLCCDVVTNMKKAPAVLQWAVDEMENRYAMLSAAGVNHIKSYNRLGQQELEKRMQRVLEPDRVQLPHIVIVIDEFADLMNVAQNEVEDSIQRLAQKSRAVGMHVIVATQRPSSEVITGIIKANLPCQIAFRVNRRIDSRVILDANGAEKLLGHGDMLYMPPGGGALMRAQGAFVADEELQAVIGFLEEHGQEPQFNRDLMQTQSSSRQSPGKSDELYNQAVEVVLGQQRGSATLLQRALAVGYTRATRLLELMEADGLVGPFVGSKSRDVLMTLEEWQQREAQMEEAMAELEAGEDEAAEDDDGEGAADEVEDDAEVDAEDDAEDDPEADEGAEDSADEGGQGEEAEQDAAEEEPEAT